MLFLSISVLSSAARTPDSRQHFWWLHEALVQQWWHQSTTCIVVRHQLLHRMQQQAKDTSPGACWEAAELYCTCWGGVTLLSNGKFLPPQRGCDCTCTQGFASNSGVLLAKLCSRDEASYTCIMDHVLKGSQWLEKLRSYVPILRHTGLQCEIKDLALWKNQTSSIPGWILRNWGIQIWLSLQKKMIVPVFDDRN